MNKLNQPPDFEHLYVTDINDQVSYKNNLMSIMWLKKAWNSKTFGGSLFKLDGALRTPLNKNIYEVRNLMVGYYDLRNVRVSEE